jgi:DinB superfamily
MAETAQQYIDRIVSNVGDRDPWQVLASSAHRLRELVVGRSNTELATQPAPGRWSVRAILAHLADCEVVTGWRLRSILAVNGVPLQAFDQNRWADAFKYEETPVADSLDLFEVSRRANLRLLRAVDPAALEHHGMHAERGRETITHLLRLNAGHDLNHIRQIERLLAR